MGGSGTAVGVGSGGEKSPGSSLGSWEEVPAPPCEGPGPAVVEAVAQSEAAALAVHAGGCQNYGLFLDPFLLRHLILRVPKKGP